MSLIPTWILICKSHRCNFKKLNSWYKYLIIKSFAWNSQKPCTRHGTWALVTLYCSPYSLTSDKLHHNIQSLTIFSPSCPPSKMPKELIYCWYDDKLHINYLDEPWFWLCKVEANLFLHRAKYLYHKDW